MIQSYNIDAFLGIDQNVTENILQPGFTADCANMDVEDGNLTVGMGYAKHISTKVPGTGTIWRMYHWHRLQENLFVVCAGDYIYYWTGSAWTQIFDYTSLLPADTHITSKKWDFEETRIGSDDYLLIANGQTQIVKWKGTGSASAFGSGEYLYESTVASVTYNAAKATAVSYTEAGYVATYTLTMPAGWAYAANSKVAWTVPCDIGIVNSCEVKIGTYTFTLDYVPMLASGDTVVITLLSTTTATAGDEWTAVEYGIEKITLTAALSTAQKDRVLVAGIYVNGENTYEVESVDGTNKILTLKEITKDQLAAGQAAKIRGGLSNIAVNYVEMFASRLFSAGDSSNPSRLYWSQPPGDVRTIEDWSMDNASDQTGGGFVDVGNTSSDPIVALCALSNQLLVIKQTSVYRLLGDRPNNYRIQQINKDIEKTVNTSIITNGDIPYWMTRAGLYYHDGQVAKLSGNARQIRKILEKVDLSSCKSCENLDRLYFTCKAGTGSYDDSIIIFDMRTRAYMLRNGFNVADICAYDGVLYSINDNRYVYKWSRDAKDYDGDQIDAYWNTPLTDLSAKPVVKIPFNLYFRGEGGFVKLDIKRGQMIDHKTYPMPATVGEIIKVPIAKDECRVFSIKIYNQAGSWFRIYGGMEMRFETREDGNV